MCNTQQNPAILSLLESHPSLYIGPTIHPAKPIQMASNPHS
jgi:hypothetical protein